MIRGVKDFLQIKIWKVWHAYVFILLSQYFVEPPFAAITVSSLLWFVSTSFAHVQTDIFAHSSLQNSSSSVRLDWGMNTFARHCTSYVPFDSNQSQLVLFFPLLFSFVRVTQCRNSFPAASWRQRAVNPCVFWADLLYAAGEIMPDNAQLQCLAKVFIPQSNLTELELFYKEEWAKMSVCTCAKLVETNHKRLETVIAEKGGSTKYWLRRMNTYARHTFQIFICIKSLTPRIIFLSLHSYAPLCVGLSHKI